MLAVQTDAEPQAIFEWEEMPPGAAADIDYPQPIDDDVVEEIGSVRRKAWISGGCAPDPEPDSAAVA